MIFSNMKNRAKGDDYNAFDQCNLGLNEGDMRFCGGLKLNNKNFNAKASKKEGCGAFALWGFGSKQGFEDVFCANGGEFDTKNALGNTSFMRGGLGEIGFKCGANKFSCQPLNACKNSTKCDKIRHSTMRDICGNLGGAMSDITKGNSEVFRDKLTSDEQVEFDIVERCVSNMSHLEDGVIKSVDRLGKSVLDNAETESKFKKVLRKMKSRCRGLGEVVLCSGGSASASASYSDGFCGNEIYHYYKRGECGLYNGIGSLNKNISAGVLCSKLEGFSDDGITRTLEVGKSENKICQSENNDERGKSDIGQDERKIGRGESEFGQSDGGSEWSEDEDFCYAKASGVECGKSETECGESGKFGYGNASGVECGESETECDESGKFGYKKGSEVSIGQKCDDYLDAVGGFGNFYERESEKSFSQKANFKNLRTQDCLVNKSFKNPEERVAGGNEEAQAEGLVNKSFQNPAERVGSESEETQAEGLVNKSFQNQVERVEGENKEPQAEGLAIGSLDEDAEGGVFIDVTGEVKDVQPIVRSCELLNMWLDKRKISTWGQKDWVKFFIKVEPCIDMCIDYYDRLVERFATNSAKGEAYINYGSAENMFETMIDLIERKKEYLRLKFFVDRLNRELDDVDKLIIGYFVFGEEENREKLLEVISRKTIYRRANNLIAKLSDFCERRGYTPSWCLKQFGGIARR